MSHYRDLIVPVPKLEWNPLKEYDLVSEKEKTEEEKRRIRELQQQGKEELRRRNLQKSGAPRSGLVDTSETEYED